MLVLWDNERILLRDLEQKLHLDSGTTTPVLKKLRAMKLINKYKTEEDERIVFVELTDKGREMRDDALNIPLNVYKNSGLSINEAEKLKECVDMIMQKF